MLALTLKRNESIYVLDRLTGQVLEVLVVSVKGDRSRLGVVASPQFLVARNAEIHQSQLKQRTPRDQMLGEIVAGLASLDNDRLERLRLELQDELQEQASESVP